MIILENNRNHLLDILSLINKLQKNVICGNNDNTCTRPILGLNNFLTYNTRPVMMYLCNNTPLEINYINGDETLTSSVFRIEDIDDNCVTLRLLTNIDGVISSTNEFATVNINCIAAIRCLPDISLTL